MQSAALLCLSGLKPPGSASSIQIQAKNSEALIREGLYLDSAEYVGGFWVVETSSLELGAKSGDCFSCAGRGSAVYAHH